MVVRMFTGIGHESMFFVPPVKQEMRFAITKFVRWFGSYESLRVLVPAEDSGQENDDARLRWYWSWMLLFIDWRTLA